MSIEKNQGTINPEAKKPENARIVRVKEKIQKLQNELASIEADIRDRENTPEYQKADELFNSGWRVEGWGLPLTDTDNETYLYHTQDDVERGYWADGVGRNTEEAYEILDLDEETAAEVLRHLNNITEERVGLKHT